MKLKTKISLASFIFLVIFAVPVLGVQAADGTVGSIQVSNQIFHISGSVVSVSMFDLTVSADYRLNWTGEAAGVLFNTSSTQTKFVHTFVLTSSSSTVVFALSEQSTGTEIDRVQITVVDIGDFLSTGLIISAGIFVLIVVIFKRVAKR